MPKKPHDVKDLNLADEGKKRIDWADRSMPVLRRVREHFEMTPRGIIESLDLKRPIYERTASYGHFGRVAADGFFTWERTDKADALRRAASA